MENYTICFSMVDHFGDDAGCPRIEELTIVEAESRQEAINVFCRDMLGEHFEINWVEAT